MKKMLFVLSAVLVAFANADVLLWTIDDSASVDDKSIYAFISPKPDNEDNWTVGRLKITTGSGEVIYPDIADPDPNPYSGNPPTYYSGEDGIWIGGGGDFWGAAWNQSVLPSNIDSATVLFAIELGI